MLGFLRKKKSVALMKNKRFVAAFSEFPFEEERGGAQLPDYTFHEYGNMHWCVRVGDISVGWGFGNGRVYANGYAVLSRLNVNAASFSGKGLPYVKLGDVYYLYEYETDAKGNDYGFCPYMRQRLNSAIRSVAEGREASELKPLIQEIGEHPDIKELLAEHHLVIRSVRVDAVGANEPADKN